ncbi:MAG: thiamine phosphate synthase [Lachnospiraceae bacterium]|nr:thiamine phosphate synthase [Lachnospiraceae bacterium]
MIMCSYKKIAVTDSSLTELPLSKQIYRIMEYDKPDMLILREKELSPEEYEALAVQILSVCQQKGVECILHSFVEVAQKLGVRKIHLSFPALKEQWQSLGSFHTIGVSVHSKEEAEEAHRLGATYLIAGHVFETNCKAGIPGRGLEFLQEVCRAVSIPVYGIGGINDENTEFVKRAGAAGECRMSHYMRN